MPAMSVMHYGTSVHKYDASLSDLHMPGAEDGLTVVSAMRHAEPILQIKSEPTHRLRRPLTGRLRSVGWRTAQGSTKGMASLCYLRFKTVLDMFVLH